MNKKAMFGMMIVALLVSSMLVSFMSTDDSIPAYISDVTPTHVWSFGGVDNFASTAGNWDTGTVPATDGSDAIKFDATSVNDCAFNLEGSFLSIILDTTYSGTVTLLRNISTVTTLTVRGTSTFTQSFGNISVGTNLVTGGTAQFTTSAYFSLVVSGTIQQTQTTVPVSTYYGNVSTHDVSISRGIVTIHGNWSVSGSWTSNAGTATFAFGSGSNVNMTGAGETIQTRAISMFHTLQIDGDVTMFTSLYLFHPVVVAGTLDLNGFIIYWEPTGSGGATITVPVTANVWSSPIASTASNAAGWSLGHVPLQGEDISFLSGCGALTWDIIRTVHNLNVTAGVWANVSVSAGSVLNVEGDILSNGRLSITFRPTWVSGFNALINGSVYLSNHSRIYITSGVVSEPYFFLNGNFFGDWQNDSDGNYDDVGGYFRAQTNVKLFVNGTFASVGAADTVAYVWSTSCVYSDWGGDVELVNLGDATHQGVIIETANFTQDLTIVNSSIEWTNAMWAEHYDYRIKYSKVVFGSLRIENCTDFLTPSFITGLPASDFLMNGTGTIYCDVSTFLNSVYIQNGSVYQQTSGFNVTKFENRGVYYTLSHLLNVVSFDNANGTFVSDSILHMTGTGYLKTDGHQATGLNYLAIDAGAVVTLKSDVHILSDTGLLTIMGTVVPNGFSFIFPEHERWMGQTVIKFNFQMTNGFTVQFTDQTVGGVVDWLWDFGDGTTSVERNPVHEYTQSGTYMASLTITDFSGIKQILTKKVTIQRPIAEEIFSPYAIAMIGLLSTGCVGYAYYDSKAGFLITVLSFGAFAILLILLIL
jgi:PKD repeat protein